MRMLTIVLAAAVLQIPGKAQAKDSYQPAGGGYVDTNHKKLGKDYYVVHEGKSNECSVVAGDFGDAPLGAIGHAPYACKHYAEAALKTFPECKGGETDEAADKKHKKK